MNDTPRPARPGFTEAQQLQARFIGEVSERERARRLHIPSYPIDNVTRDIVSDRDDGVYVEAEHRGDGGYRVHVTIADVAAHIRAGSPLAAAAAHRGFTLYGPGWTDPMFPQNLEEQLSLEHHRERLGMTVSITLDKKFRPVHTAFMPVITRPDNSSYAEVPERVRTDPQFRLMADIAAGIRRSYFGGAALPMEEIIGHRALRRIRTPQQMDAMEMVATYMLLANESVAEFFEKSGLPFLYRTFDETRGDTHAAYSTEPGRHTALERMGLNGNYCHFTSPIRRAPDYFDGLMVHYAVRILGEYERGMLPLSDKLDGSVLHQQLWARGPEILALTQELDNGKAAGARRRLTKILGEAADAAMPKGSPLSKGPLRALVSTTVIAPLPIGREQLAGYAAHINELARSPEIRAIEKQNEKYGNSIDLIETVQETHKEELAALPREKFSSALRAAALTGEMPRALFDEAIDRIRSGEWDQAQDAFTIFILADWPRVHRWTALKARVSQAIKHQPGVVNALRMRFRQHIAPAVLEEHEAHVFSSEKPTEGHEEPARIHEALLVMKGEGTPAVSAPYYSVGHNKRAALSHARYAFLEAFAFHELKPVEQTAVPNILYAELDIPGSGKRELLDRMVGELDAELSVETSAVEQGVRTRLTVQGGELAQPIRVEAVASDEPAATQTALRRMLRDPSFKNAVSRSQQVGNEVLHPQKVLEERVEAQGGTVEFIRLTSGNGPHQVRAWIDLGSRSFGVNGAGPNVDRATRAAALKAFAMLDWMLPPPEQAASWVTDSRRPPAGTGPEYFQR